MLILDRFLSKFQKILHWFITSTILILVVLMMRTLWLFYSPVSTTEKLWQWYWIVTVICIHIYIHIYNVFTKCFSVNLKVLYWCKWKRKRRGYLNTGTFSAECKTKFCVSLCLLAISLILLLQLLVLLLILLLQFLVKLPLGKILGLFWHWKQIWFFCFLKFSLSLHFNIIPLFQQWVDSRASLGSLALTGQLI